MEVKREENILSQIFGKHPDEIDECAVDELLEYSAELQENDLQFLTIAIENIGNLEVSWERPWYQMADFLQKEKFRIKDNAQNGRETFRCKVFDRDEIDHIEKNWREMIHKYDLTDQPASLFRCKIGEQHKKSQFQQVRYYMVAYLARGLHRTLYQVYKRCLVEYLYVDKGPYTPIEEKIISLFLKYCTQVRSPVQELVRILGRAPRHIYQKLEDLRFGKKERTKAMKWDLARASKLLKYLLKYSKLPLEQLKYKEFDHTFWLRIEKKMKNYHINLRRFWYSKLHVQLFVQDDIKLRSLLKKLFLILRSSKYKKWRDIKWKDLVSHFPDGVTWWFLYYSAIGPFKPTSAHTFLSVADAAEHFLTERLAGVRKRRLKRVVLNSDNKLEYAVKDD